MIPARTLMTAEELLALPDDGCRHELLDGVLVTMAPPGGEHGEIQVAGSILLGSHVREHGLGRVFGEVGIILGRNPDRVRAPDLCFVAADRLPPGRSPRGYLDVVPDLVAEIISPNDRAAEVQDKVHEWLRAGARLVWAIYPDTRTVVAYRGLRDIRTYTAGDLLDAAPVLPGFSCPVAALFE